MFQSVEKKKKTHVIYRLEMARGNPQPKLNKNTLGVTWTGSTNQLRQHRRLDGLLVPTAEMAEPAEPEPLPTVTTC